MNGNSVQSTTSVQNNNFLKAVRNAKPYYFGKINKVKYSYIQWLELIETYKIDEKFNGKPIKVYNKEKQAVELRHLEKKNRNVPRFCKDLISMMEKTFPKNKVTAISFGSFGPDAKSFKIHKDKMDVVYLQVLGTVRFSLWKANPGVEKKETFNPLFELDLVTKFYEKIFGPDELIWIPRGTYHYIEPLETRMAISFGIEGNPNPKTYI